MENKKKYDDWQDEQPELPFMSDNEPCLESIQSPELPVRCFHIPPNPACRSSINHGISGDTYRLSRYHGSNEIHYVFYFVYFMKYILYNKHGGVFELCQEKYLRKHESRISRVSYKTFILSRLHRQYGRNKFVNISSMICGIAVRIIDCSQPSYNCDFYIRSVMIFYKISFGITPQ